MSTKIHLAASTAVLLVAAVALLLVFGLWYFYGYDYEIVSYGQVTLESGETQLPEPAAETSPAIENST